MGRNNLAAEFEHAIGRNNFRSGICSCDREERKLYLLRGGTIYSAEFVPVIGRNNFRSRICYCDREEQLPQRNLLLRYKSLAAEFEPAIGWNKLAAEFERAIGRNGI